MLDEIGHGVRRGGGTPRQRQRSQGGSVSGGTGGPQGGGGGGALPAPTTKPPTPPQAARAPTPNNKGSGMVGTLGKSRRLYKIIISNFNLYSIIISLLAKAPGVARTLHKVFKIRCN